MSTIRTRIRKYDGTIYINSKTPLDPIISSYTASVELPSVKYSVREDIDTETARKRAMEILFYETGAEKH